MKFGNIEIAASDPAASVGYYRDVLGFTLVAQQGEQFAWVELGGTEMLIRPQGTYPLPCVVYYTDDPVAAADELRQRGVEVEQIGSCFHFTDPDNNSFQIVNPNEDHSD